MDGWMSEWMNEWMIEWKNEWMNKWGGLPRSRQFCQPFPWRPWSPTGIVQPVVPALNWESGKKCGSYLNRHWSKTLNRSQGFCILGLTLVSTADFCAPPFNYVFSWSTRAKNMPTSCKRPAHTFTDASFKCLSFKNRFFWLISHQNIHMHVTDVHLCVTHNLFSWPTVLNTIWICKPSQDLCSLQIWKTYRLGTTGLSELFQPFIL